MAEANLSKITSWPHLSQEQIAFLFEEGPRPVDLGAVKAFTGRFIGRFDVEVPVPAMASFLEKIERKKRKRQKKRENGNLRRPPFVNNLPTRFFGQT